MFKTWLQVFFVVAVLCGMSQYSLGDDVLSAHEHELRAALAQDVIDPHQVLQACWASPGGFVRGTTSRMGSAWRSSGSTGSVKKSVLSGIPVILGCGAWNF